MLDLEQRLQAYLDVVELYPNLPVDERQRLFSIALWPPQEEHIDYDHLMRCRDPFCRECAGTGEMAA